VASARVLEALDEVEDGKSRIASVLKAMLDEQLALENRVEARIYVMP